VTERRYGTVPTPGAWDRISLLVPDLAAAVEALRRRGVTFRTGTGARQALLEDPSGSPVELFEPLAGYHERRKRRV